MLLVQRTRTNKRDRLGSQFDVKKRHGYVNILQNIHPVSDQLYNSISSFYQRPGKMFCIMVTRHEHVIFAYNSAPVSLPASDKFCAVLFIILMFPPH